MLGAYYRIFILHELNIQVNPGPDFKQTGGKLQRIIMELWEEICILILDENKSENHPMNDICPNNMELVYSKEWSASKFEGGMKMN